MIFVSGIRYDMSRVTSNPVNGVSDQCRTQTGLYSLRWLEALNFGFKKKRDCTIYLAKTKALIRCMITMQLICVFAYAKTSFLKTWLI